MTHPKRDAIYYQHLHDVEPSYQTNNWLLEELEQIRSFGASSLLELACGNGRFLECAAPIFNQVHGCDWAVSPRIEDVLARHPNAHFHCVDLYHDLPPCQAELVASADFLEHLAPESLQSVLLRVDTLSPMAFHKIACYDDGHSHLSILPPTHWLDLFQAVDPGYRLERVEFRLGDPGREIAIFSKGRPVPSRLRIEQILATAEHLLNEGKMQEALQLLGEGLVQNPGNSLLRIAEANVLLAKGKSSHALGALPAQSPTKSLPAGTGHERHFDLGKAISGRNEVTRYFTEHYEASSILDVGCGSGPVWPMFFRKGMRVTGVDLVPEEWIRANSPEHPATYRCGNFFDIPFPETFEAVYSSHMIEHVPDSERFLHKFFSCLRPDGAFCLIWPPPKPEIVSGHVHIFNLGLMLYHLVRLGVDCRGVEMVRCGYCLALMGRYRTFHVPDLTHNEGDLDRLGDFFPFHAYQGFNGDHPPCVVELQVDESGTVQE